MIIKKSHKTFTNEGSKTSTKKIDFNNEGKFVDFTSDLSEKHDGFGDHSFH